MKDSDDEPLSLLEKQMAIMHFSPPWTPLTNINWHPSQHMEPSSANPCTPAEVSGGYSWGHEEPGPCGWQCLLWCYPLAYPCHGSEMGCFHQSRRNQKWRTPTMCESSRRCLWSGHLMYLLGTGTVVPLRNKSNSKFISLSQHQWLSARKLVLHHFQKWQIFHLIIIVLKYGFVSLSFAVSSTLCKGSCPFPACPHRQDSA